MTLTDWEVQNFILDSRYSLTSVKEKGMISSLWLLSHALLSITQEVFGLVHSLMPSLLSGSAIRSFSEDLHRSSLLVKSQPLVLHGSYFFTSVGLVFCTCGISWAKIMKFFLIVGLFYWSFSLWSFVHLSKRDHWAWFHRIQTGKWCQYSWAVTAELNLSKEDLMRGNPYMHGSVTFLKQSQNSWTQNSNCALYNVYLFSTSASCWRITEICKHGT